MLTDIKKKNYETLKHCFIIFLVFACCNSQSSARAIGGTETLDCARIEDDAKRLECYDIIAEEQRRISRAQTDETPFENLNHESYLFRNWKIDDSDQFFIMAHRPNYIQLYSHNSSPNTQSYQNISTGQSILGSEVTFQISLKSRIYHDIMGSKADLWFAYTQRSFWQFYDFEDSSPFRDSNYEPEILLNYPLDMSILGLSLKTITAGFNHQSNGRSEPYSRSWNRVVVNLGFERGPFVLLLNTWHRIPEGDDSDNNPDINGFMGYGELRGYYFWGEHQFGIMLRNNLNFNDNHGAVQLEWSFPITKTLSGYVQGFSGYGESLLDYNHKVSRIGAGFMLRLPICRKTTGCKSR